MEGEIHMLIEKLRHVPVVASATVLATGLGVWLLATPPVRAIDNPLQIIAGGSSQAEGSTQGGTVTNWTSPGLANVFGPDFPNTGLGEQSAQLNMPAGTLSRLRVRVTTQNAPSSGTFTLMVRVNGADTQLTCTLNGTGECNAGNKVKGLNNNSLLAVRASNNFVGSGTFAWNYSMLLD
jgi:hypothetical protein